MKFLTGLFAATVALFAVACAPAHASEADTAPIAVTQERLLAAGDFEVFGTFEDAKFDGNQDAQLVRFGGLFAPTDTFTLGASSTYINESGQLGDLVLFVTADAGDLVGLDVRPSLGINIPVDYENVNSVGGVTVPSLQVPFTTNSSGTVDLLPALAVLGSVGPFDAGAQYSGEIRFDENDDDFTYGDEHVLAGWLSTETSIDGLSFYGAGEYTYTGDISGVAGLGDTSSEVLLVGAGAKSEFAGFTLKGEAYIPVVEDFNSSVAQFAEVRTVRVSLQRTF